ncbi:MAG TPA: hypothetical protein VHH53_00810, partial [Pseudonocardiaceae bacterium]|nr:hypothetical protein [Pseudonocardiaceae bacterium]
MKHFSLLVVAAAVAVAVAVPAAGATPAGHDRVPLGRQVLPANDGWAAEGAGTSGGAAAPPENVHFVDSRAEFVTALAAPSPKIIYVHGV